jgi:eukaryotic-like serine/threonine-protein kinase
MGEDRAGASILDNNGFDLAEVMLDASPDPGPFSDFGPYRISREPIGRGGMGEVFLAEDIAAHRRVAIKSPGYADPQLRERFATEIFNLGQLEHPFIARLCDHGLRPDGTPYFAMEYVEGKPIDVYCREQNCTIEERLRLFRSVCEAVQYAHARLIVHRDLKPSNILVTEGGTPKVLDFGISKQLESNGELAHQTHTQLRFTLAYAAPEQLRGQPAKAYTDVYTLGVVLYQLLTGRLPYDLDRRTPAEAELLVTGESEPEKPSAVANVRSSEWSDLDVLCLTALKKDAGKRYTSVLELAQDVDRYLNGEPLKARPDSRSYRLGKFLRRNRRVILSAAAVFFLIAGLIGFFTFRLSKARDAALAEAARTRQIQRFMLSMFGAGDQHSAPSNDLRVVTLLDRGAQEAGSLNSDPETQAEIYRTLGAMYELLGRFEKADRSLHLALDKTKAAFGAESPEAANALVPIALLRGDQGDYKEAERLVREALDSLNHRLPGDDPAVVEAKSVLGRVLAQGGSYEKAAAILEPITQHPPSADNEMDSYRERLSALNHAHYNAGHRQTTEALNRKILALDLQRHGPSNPLVGEDLGNVATDEANAGRFAEAEKLYRQSVEIHKAWYGPDHPDTVMHTSLLASVLIQNLKFDEAEDLLQQVVTIQERNYGKVHPNVAYALDTRGRLELKRGKLDEAEADLSRAAAIDKGIFGDANHQTATVNAHLAQVFIAKKEYARAEPLLRGSVTFMKENSRAGDVSTGVMQILLGRVLLRLKRYEEAEQSLTAGSAIIGPNPGVALAKTAENARDDLAEIHEHFSRVSVAQNR